MKIETYKYPKSSFLSIDKDISLIVQDIMKNDNLKKMLYYTSKDCLSRPKLNEDQTLELFENNIKLTSKIYIDNEHLIYLIIRMNNFYPSSNPQFRNNTIEFDIICNYELWHLKDFQLRPYRIAAELDTMFNNRHLTGIGDLQFSSAGLLTLTNEIGGLCLLYDAIHGGEDKVKMPNPMDEEQMIENFNKIFNDEDVDDE